MSSPSRPGDERIAEFLAAKRATPAPGPTGPPCPEGTRLAGLVEDRLLPWERGEVERHVRECADCAGWVRLFGEETAARPGAGRIVRFPWASFPRTARWAAAGAIVVGAGFLASSLLRARRGAAGSEATLVAVARDLARERPDLFAGFVPLDASERAAPSPATLRGDVSLLYPTGRILETLPAYRWEPVAGVSAYRVRLFRADGTLIAEATANGPRLEPPRAAFELAPGGRYLWEVSGEGPVGSFAARRAFEVAPMFESEVFKIAVRTIDARAPQRVRDLVRAHFAIRLGLVGEAETAARSALERAPDDPVRRETMGLVLRLLGSSEAEDFATRAAGPNGKERP